MSIQSNQIQYILLFNDVDNDVDSCMIDFCLAWFILDMITFPWSMLYVSCKDVAIDCEFVGKANNEGELMMQLSWFDHG